MKPAFDQTGFRADPGIPIPGARRSPDGLKSRTSAGDGGIYFFHDTAFVEDRSEIGAGTRIWHSAQIRGGARIGKRCSIGKGAYVDKHVIIGNNVKIQNHVSIYEGITIEDDVILAPNCTFTNDLYPRAFNANWQVSPTRIKRGASIGANATILCGITIGEYSMIGIGSVVTSDTQPYALMVGNPARLKNYVCRCGIELKKIHHEEPILRYQCAGCGKTLSISFALSG